MESLRVALGSRSYPIHIGAGLIGRAELYRAVPAATERAAIVTNAVVGAALPRDGEERAAARGARSPRSSCPTASRPRAGKPCERVFDALLAARCGRDTLLVALGGGVVGDLAGFAAAVYQRGIAFVQVPTTLLAQVDSSVGGKTAINHPRGKNMIGAFHQPRAVIADVATLDTLPERELRAGLAEVIKHGLALDAAFFAWLEQNIDKLLARDRGALAHAVRRSLRAQGRNRRRRRARGGRRALLNLGHTFGHAIEAGTGYGAWLHGEAVAAGMVMAAELSLQMESAARKAMSRGCERSLSPCRPAGQRRRRLRPERDAASSWRWTRRPRAARCASWSLRGASGERARCAVALDETARSAKSLSLQRNNCIFNSSVMSLPRSAPSGQGLYHPDNEHDACGVGFVAHIKGKKSHTIVEQGLTVLKNLTHRGAVGWDPKLSDGAGCLIQIPDRFCREEMAKQGVKLPPLGQYGVGMVFLPRDPASRLACEYEIERAIKDEGQVLLGWRDVPVDNARPRRAGEEARAGDPAGVHRPRRAASRSPTRSSASSTSSARAPATPSRR